ncbi:hypothetical protein YC2023_059747 [Brassica napus]
MNTKDCSESELSRATAVKKVWEHIKGNNLQNPENRKEIICDDKLKTIFEGKDKVGFTEIAKLLSPHFPKSIRIRSEIRSGSAPKIGYLRCPDTNPDSKILDPSYFYGSRSGYPRVIEYRDGYPKSGYPETTNPDNKSTDPPDLNPDLNTLNFPDIRIRPRPT